MSEEVDIVFTDIEIEKENIIIHMPVEILKVVYDGEKEKVINLWEKKKKEIFGVKKLKPLEILELARKVFHEDNVKDKVVIDISKIEAWKLCPTNPHGWCTAHVQGIVVGNVGFFVSLEAISKELIKRLPKMNDTDKEAYLLSLILILIGTTKFEDKHKKPFIKMLEEIIEDLKK